MDTLEFFQRVLPTSGLYAAIVINSSVPKQGFYTTIEDLERAVLRLDQGGNNTYYAVNTFVNKEGGRKQANVTACKSLYLDIDCGPSKPFPSFKEGLVALGDFLKTTGLPAPMVISSGVGLHVYWVLDQELPKDQWQPLAEALKHACAVTGFKVDPAVPADSARVLRPIGTHNPKNGKEVTLLIDRPPVTVGAMQTVLSRYRSIIAPSPSAPRRTTLLDNLKVTQEFPPVAGDVVVSKCLQMEWITANQAQVDEPTWYAMLGIAAHTTDPEIFAIKWSNQHPGFDHARTVSKLHQWKAKTTGPTTCAKFEELRPGGCKGCKFKDKVGTPARLGVQYAEIAPPATAPVSPDEIIPLPYPFKRTADGIKMTIDETDIDVCRFDVIPLSYGLDEGLGYEVVRYSWQRPHKGWTELTMRQAYLAEGSREFPTSIADQGIVLYNKKLTETFQLMLRAYMDELRKAQSMTNLYNSMGWKEDRNQFLLGTELFKREADDSVTHAPVVAARTISKVTEDLYGTAGSLGTWVGFTSLLDRAHMPVHKYAIGMSLAAPLFAFTGLKGLTVSLYGQTGTGKTLAQLWAQSVWGDPAKLHYAAKFTQNSLFARLALYNNLPFTIDEATLMDEKDIGDFLYWVTQGRDKARLDRFAAERDPKTWSLPVMVSANRSMTNAMYNAGLDSDAQMARLLEITMPDNQMFKASTDVGRRIFETIHENYGHVGRTFLQNLMELGNEGIMASIKEAPEEFQRRYGYRFGGSERYWEMGLVLPDLALRMAKQWGLVKFDWTDSIELIMGQLGATREGISTAKADAFDLVAEFLNDVGTTVATIIHTKGFDPVLDPSVPLRGEIRARYDLYRDNVTDPFTYGTLMMDKRAFRTWMARRKADWKLFKAELEREQADATPASGKASLGRDTPFRLGQTYVVGVNLGHPRMASSLVVKDAVEDLALGQLMVVK